MLSRQIVLEMALDIRVTIPDTISVQNYVRAHARRAVPVSPQLSSSPIEVTNL